MPQDEELAAIGTVIKTYVDGMCHADAGMLRQAMHPKACCIGHYDGGLEWDDTESFITAVLDAVDAPDPDPWYRIRSISVAGDMAMVHVEDIWLEMHFDDYLTLLFHDGSWTIVSKVFYLRPACE